MLRRALLPDPSGIARFPGVLHSTFWLWDTFTTSAHLTSTHTPGFFLGISFSAVLPSLSGLLVYSQQGWENYVPSPKTMLGISKMGKLRPAPSPGTPRLKGQDTAPELTYSELFSTSHL
jgi:hypothetical protein